MPDPSDRRDSSSLHQSKFLSYSCGLLVSFSAFGSGECLNSGQAAEFDRCLASAMFRKALVSIARHLPVQVLEPLLLGSGGCAFFFSLGFLAGCMHRVRGSYAVYCFYDMIGIPKLLDFMLLCFCCAPSALHLVIWKRCWFLTGFALVSLPRLVGRRSRYAVNSL
jgi:hypothetical protein